jgi:hypothetical protein
MLPCQQSGGISHQCQCASSGRLRFGRMTNCFQGQTGSSPPATAPPVPSAFRPSDFGFRVSALVLSICDNAGQPLSIVDDLFARLPGAGPPPFYPATVRPWVGLHNQDWLWCNVSVAGSTPADSAVSRLCSSGLIKPGVEGLRAAQAAAYAAVAKIQFDGGQFRRDLAAQAVCQGLLSVNCIFALHHLWPYLLRTHRRAASSPKVFKRSV